MALKHMAMYLVKKSDIGHTRLEQQIKKYRGTTFANLSEKGKNSITIWAFAFLTSSL